MRSTRPSPLLSPAPTPLRFSPNRVPASAVAPGSAGHVARRGTIFRGVVLRSVFLSVLLFGVVLFGAGCSTTPAAAPAEVPLETIELFMSRSTLTETEFEQYKLSGSRLYHECGEIRRGRFVAEEQEVTSVEAAALGHVKRASAELRQMMAAKQWLLDEPGRSTDLIDPGQLYLTLTFTGEPIKVKTSLDSISAAGKSAERKIKEIAELLRAQGGVRCGNRSFYGIGTKTG